MFFDFNPPGIIKQVVPNIFIPFFVPLQPHLGDLRTVRPSFPLNRLLKPLKKAFFEELHLPLQWYVHHSLPYLDNRLDFSFSVFDGLVG